MITERDPPRLSRGGEDVPAELSRALVAARGRRVGEAVIAAVAARLPQGPPGSAPAGPEEEGAPSSGHDGEDAPDSGGARSGDPQSGAARPHDGAPDSGGQPPRVPASGDGGAGSGNGAPTVIPPMWPGIVVGAALGALVGTASLLIPTSSPAPSGPPAALAPSSAHSAFSSTETGTETETEADYLRRADALIAASPAQALAMAEAHLQRYPGGTLTQDREVIAVFALAALGRKVEARARARLLLTLYPDSPHRRRLEQIAPPSPSPSP